MSSTSCWMAARSADDDRNREAVHAGAHADAPQLAGFGITARTSIWWCLAFCAALSSAARGTLDIQPVGRSRLTSLA